MTTDTDTLVALAAQITPGPWAISGENRVCRQIDGEHHAICTDQYCYAPEPEKEVNARAIALLPDLLPEVIANRARIEALEAEVARRSEMHECAMAERDDCILDWSDTKAERDRLAEEVERLTDALASHAKRKEQR